MYPAKFEYVRAGSVQEAVSLLASNPDAKVIAGGHSLLPLMKLRLATPGALVDIGRIAELKGIRREGNGVTIGSLTTHNEIASSADVQSLAPALAEAASHVGDMQVRNRGTIGGNIAHADPASDLPTVLVALGAEIHVAGPGGSRTIKAADFFTDLLTTDLHAGEVLTAVHVPAAPKSAYVKFENPASGYAMLGACASLGAGGASVALGGGTPTPRRLSGVENALKAGQSAADAAKHAADGIDDWMGDIHASADYRKSVASVFVERALNAAAAR